MSPTFLLRDIFWEGGDFFYSKHCNVYVTCGFYWIDENENKIFQEDLTQSSVTKFRQNLHNSYRYETCKTKNSFYETVTLYALSMFNYMIRTLILDSSQH